jgi:hypothetical protein
MENVLLSPESLTYFLRSQSDCGLAKVHDCVKAQNVSESKFTLFLRNSYDHSYNACVLAI